MHLVSKSSIPKNLSIFSFFLGHPASSRLCLLNLKPISVVACTLRRSTPLQVPSSIKDWELRKFQSAFHPFRVGKMSNKDLNIGVALSADHLTGHMAHSMYDHGLVNSSCHVE